MGLLQGTIGTEIMRECDIDRLDAVFVAVGGGGLLAGIAAYIKALKPGIKVIGVEPTGESIRNGEGGALVVSERGKPGCSVRLWCALLGASAACPCQSQEGRPGGSKCALKCAGAARLQPLHLHPGRPPPPPGGQP